MVLSFDCILARLPFKDLEKITIHLEDHMKEIWILGNMIVGAIKYQSAKALSYN